MIQIEFLEGEDESLRILFHGTKQNNQIAHEFTVKAKDALSSADELFTLLNEINSNESRRVKLFPQFKAKANSFFSILFSGFSFIESWENWGTNIKYLFDPKFSHLPIEWAFNGDFFLCEKFIIARNPIKKSQPVNHDFNSIQLESMCIAGNFSRDSDIQHSVESELNNIDQLMESNIQKTGPVFGPFESKMQIIELLNSTDIVHYSGHFKTGKTEGWKLNDLETFDKHDFDLIQDIPSFIFNNVCGKEYSSYKTDFTTTLLNQGVKSIISPIAPIKTTSAAKFSILFYSIWKEGFSAGEALLKARSEYISENGISDPTWLQYSIYGDTTISIKPESQSKKIPPVLKILFSLIILFLISVSAIQFKNWFAGKFISKKIHFTQKYQDYNIFVSENSGKARQLPTNIDVRNRDIFTFFGPGFDTLTLDCSIQDSILTVNTSNTAGQFIFGDSLENILFIDRNTIVINPVNNGLCDIQLFDAMDFGIQLGIQASQKELNWFDLNSQNSSIKLDPFFQNKFTLKLMNENKRKYFSYNCEYSLCDSESINFSDIWKNGDTCWRFIGF